jgi:CRP-like cAMP-binding protein
VADPVTPAFEILRTYLEARAAFTDEELAFVRTVFVPRRVPAGDFLQRAGDVARHAAFVAKGCLRSYVIDAKGKEHIVQFAPETWWLADSDSLSSGSPSQYFIDAIEDADLLLIDGPSHLRLVERVPGYAAALAPGCSAMPPPRITASSALSARPPRSATWRS